SWPETILCGIFAALIALSIMFSRRAIRMRFDSFFENLIPPPSVPTVNQHAAPGKPESWRVRFEKRLREAYPTRVYWISMAIWGLWMVPILDSSQTFHAFIHWLAIAFITLSLTWVLAVVTYAWRQKVRSGKWESTILRGTPRRFLMQPMSFLFVGAGLYWTWQQAICGTIAFDINDRDFTVSLTGPSLNSNQNFSADFYPLRVRAGNYRWEVRHGSDPIDMGELEVTPGQTQTIQIRSPFPIGEADAACLPGRWGYHWCVGGNSMSIASRKQANTEIPGYVDISMDGNSQFELRSHTSVISDCLDALSGMAAASVSKSGASPESVYTIQVSSPANHERGPKWIDLLHHETDKGKQTVVAQGIFAADTKTLSLRLVPANSERPTWSSSFSDNCISLSFERASDRTLLQGEWNSTTPVDVVTDSPKPNSDKAGVNPNYHLPARMSFIGDRFEVRPTDRAPGKIDAGTFRLDPTQKPKRITLFRTPQKGTIQISEGIYRFDGDQLTLSINDHAEVPRDFEPLPNLKEHRLLKLQRVKE
ncbi:MAG: hypothetical protein JWM11_6353, partial [Planctomycetaceae bacterium]|nr:hypothetical protein [Planctomycetaceae bacterium]